MLLAACGIIGPESAAWAELFLFTLAFIAQLIAEVDQLPIRAASHFDQHLLADQ